MSKSTPLSQIPSNQNDMDDPLVQEVLAEIAQGNDNPQKFAVPQMTPTQMYNGSPSVAPKEFITPPAHHPYYPTQYSNVSPKNFNISDNDIKQIVAVVAIVFVVQVFPFEQFVYKYVSVETVPYSGLLIKAVLAGGLFYLAKKYFV